MFPSTLTGLFFFIVLLLPGFAYLVGKERHGTERHTSPFRETISVVAASVTTEVIVLALFALARWLLPSRTPDVGALIRGGNSYITNHYRSLAVWTLCLLALAVALAYFVTVPGVRRFPRRVLALMLWPLGKIQRVDRIRKSLVTVETYPHDSTVSGWWLLFEKFSDKRDIQVLCTLDDGFAIQGMFKSFNTSADDSPDRDLILSKPIYIRQLPQLPMTLFNAGMVCVSARRIATLFVSYRPSPNRPDPRSLPEQGSAMVAPDPVVEPLEAKVP